MNPTLLDSYFERVVRWQTGNGANFSLFWEREAKGILPKKTEVFISGLFFFGYFLLEGQKKVTLNK
jgi:hypothetical protein